MTDNSDELKKTFEESKVHKRCKYCQNEIDNKATICHYCNKSQNPVWFYLEKFAVIISILLVLLAYLQFQQARNKNIRAQKALDQAQDAKMKVSELDLIVNQSRDTLEKIRIGSETASNEVKKANQKIVELDKIILESVNRLNLLKDSSDRASADFGEAKNKIAQLDELIKESQKSLQALKKNTEIATNEAKDAKSKIIKLNIIIEESQKNLSLLKNNIEFMNILLAAKNDNWDAYRNLKSMADDPSDPYYKVSLNAVLDIRTTFGGPIAPGFLNVKWNEGIDPNSLPLQSIEYNYRNLPDVLHADLVKLVKNRDDLNKKDKMSFFIEVMKTSNSMIAKHYAAKYFIENSGDNNLKWRPFIFEPIFEWWAENEKRLE